MPVGTRKRAPDSRAIDNEIQKLNQYLSFSSFRGFLERSPHPRSIHLQIFLLGSGTCHRISVLLLTLRKSHPEPDHTTHDPKDDACPRQDSENVRCSQPRTGSKKGIDIVTLRCVCDVRERQIQGQEKHETRKIDCRRWSRPWYDDLEQAEEGIQGVLRKLALFVSG